ncbi:uncharacterized protein HMF8227_01408 [Saliniradius amylolyticus]|uniref:26 kDa periplasmic immunogenic protein n=1 Tax=Saliniradius amylolyticus TaxID=2183582 RepID=A0A2S2E2L9_9ALTE|nr:SIMPL domain-containing protein [Saliniradius amylolyticus]AWL11883.1 uncharacterized protein HMF8227_01408 [Saliniradius amylolyticus]
MKHWWLVLLCCLSLSAMAQTGQVIEVTGQGRVLQVPDKFSFSLYLEEQGSVVAKLNQNLQANTEEIQEFLLKQGVARQDIRSTQVNLRPNYHHTEQGRQHQGFTLSREIAVNLYQLEKYDTILDGVMKLGASRISDFRQGFADAEGLYMTSLSKAVANAKLRAEQIAKSLGVAVGQVMAVTEQSAYQPRPMPMMRMSMEADSAGSMAGQSEIAATVRVKFELQPR